MEELACDYCMCVLKQRGSGVFIRGTFIGNNHQEPSILLTLSKDDDDVNDNDDEAGVHVRIFICTFPLLVFGAQRRTDVQRSR